MNTEFWEAIITVVGSGTFFSILTWAITKVKNMGAEEAKYIAHLEEVDNIKRRQTKQGEQLSILEKRVEEVDRSIDVRLTSIEVDITHIKEMQIHHKSELKAVSDDIKSLLRDKSGR